MTKQLNLQDMFLNTLRKERTEVTVFLTNGYQIKGTVKGYDNFVLMMDSDGKQQMIYKHAISTITPARSVNLMGDSDDEVAEEQPAVEEVKRKPGRPKKVVASEE